MSKLRLPPGPTDFFGPLKGLRHRPLAYLMELVRDHGDFVHFKLGNLHGFLVADLEALKHVMCDTSGNYTKENRHWDQLRLFAGRGIFTDDGPQWRRHRKLAQPAFGREGLENYSVVMTRKARGLVKAWEGSGAAGDVVDISRETSLVTLQVVAEALLNSDMSETSKEVESALRVVMTEAERRITSLAPLPLWVPTARNLRTRAAIRALDDVVFGMINERRDSGKCPYDLLDTYMKSQEEPGGVTMTDHQIRDELMTILLAGHETTGIALSFTLMLLVQHPKILSGVRGELRAVLRGDEPTLERVAELKYLKMVVQESMRLYPPVWNVTRTPGRDDTVLGYDIPKGSFMFVSSYVLSRHPRYWKEPEKFDPDRWLPGGEGETNRHIYIPFGTGPRMCLGQSFAMTEIQIILAALLQRYDFALPAGFREEVEPALSLRPKHGIQMRVRTLPT